jgi:pre-mRNA-splicing factor ATP-dependent RNA helicase DHX38/PRP16
VRPAGPTVKDNSSDFAKMAREGSVTLRAIRENKEKNAMRQKFWELGGTRMGNAVGVKEGEKNGEIDSDNETDPSHPTPTPTGEGDVNAEEKRAEESVQENAQGEVDYKKSAGFAAHVTTKKDNDGPVSEFAKKKSLRQQREYLPAFTVRDELLNVIRENNIVIVVGETGSG